MLKINKLLITSVLILTQLPLVAQNNTNSPYTRFGYGDLANRSFGAGRAMGGIGYGLRSSKQINPMNPASYTAMDSLTFLFDFGVAGQLSWFSQGDGARQHDVNGNIEYIAMQFPLHRRVAMSVGILPYSFVGYKFGAVQSDPNKGAAYKENFSGTGGLNDLYVGLSIDIWKKRLAVGANVGYLFGDILHTQDMQVYGEGTDVYNTFRSQDLEVRDLKLDFGIQYTHPIGVRENITVGATYSPSRRLNAKSYYITQKYQSSGNGEVLSSDTVSGQKFDIPNAFGVGVSYEKKNKLTLAADFSYEDWSKALYFSEKGDFRNRMRVAVGGEFIPNYMNKAYFSRVRYRAGLNYSNSYLRLNRTESNPKGESYDEYGVSIGLGLPLVDNRSLINVSFEYVKKQPDVKSMIGEQYFRFTLNYTFNEYWFFKKKVD